MSIAAPAGYGLPTGLAMLALGTRVAPLSLARSAACAPAIVSSGLIASVADDPDFASEVAMAIPAAEPDAASPRTGSKSCGRTLPSSAGEVASASCSGT